MATAVQEDRVEAITTEAVTTHERIVKEARQLFDRQPDWVTFYREVFSQHGLILQNLPTRDERDLFATSLQHAELQAMMADLRKVSKPPPTEPTRVITIRLPKTLHEALRAEAYDHRASMNQLCITKLVHIIDGELVPVES